MKVDFFFFSLKELVGFLFPATNMSAISLVATFPGDAALGFKTTYISFTSNCEAAPLLPFAHCSW